MIYQVRKQELFNYSKNIFKTLALSQFLFLSSTGSEKQRERKTDREKEREVKEVSHSK